MQKWINRSVPPTEPSVVNSDVRKSESHEPNEAILKSIDTDRKRIEGIGNRKRALANQPASETKSAIIDFHLDQLGTVISGGTSGDDDG